MQFVEGTDEGGSTVVGFMLGAVDRDVVTLPLAEVRLDEVGGSDVEDPVGVPAPGCGRIVHPASNRMTPAAPMARTCCLSRNLIAAPTDSPSVHRRLDPAAEEKDPGKDALNRLYRHDLRVAPWAGTAHGVLQAINTYEHHEGTVRGSDRAERNMLRTVTGDFATLDRHAWNDLSRVLQLQG